MPAIPASACSGACAIRSKTAGRTASRSRSTPTLPWPMPMKQAPQACHLPPSGATRVPNSLSVNANIRSVTCPFTGEELAAVPAIRPDVTFIHAQKADRKGNVLIEGIVGVQKEAVLAAKRAVVTVEEVVDDLAAHPNACVLPGWTVTAICRSTRRRPSILRPWLLPARQRKLHRLGQDRRGPGNVPGLDEAKRARRQRPRISRSAPNI
jgi:plasmid stabilization system protein ParE